MINTIIGISVALEKFDYIHIGHISTHPLENYFGMFRIASKNDHSVFNILRAIGKSVIVKKKLDELNLSDSIRSRLGISGAKVDYTIIEGKLMENYFLTPFDIFKLLWEKIIWQETDMNNLINFFRSYKTIEWSERIASSSSLSGSNIVARYYFQKINNKKENKKVSKHVKRYTIVRNFIKPKEIAAEVIVAKDIDNPRDFFIQIYGFVNEKREELGFQFEDLDEVNFYKKCTKEGMNYLHSW